MNLKKLNSPSFAPWKFIKHINTQMVLSVVEELKKNVSSGVSLDLNSGHVFVPKHMCLVSFDYKMGTIELFPTT